MVFFLMPAMSVLAVYVLAAILPAAFLMRYIYRQDSIEKEPSSLLGTLILLGIFAALVSIVLEMIGEKILPLLVSRSSPVYVIVLAFLVVAVVEEGTKIFFLYRRTWNDPNFNYRFDGIVYAVFISLGFAAFENVKYVLYYGLSVAAPRALLAIPGHMGFAVFMGIFYGRAKLCHDCGNERGKVLNLAAGYLAAVLLHGFYDSCAMISSTRSTVVFVAFVASMYFIVIRLIHRESAGDAPV